METTACKSYETDRIEAKHLYETYFSATVDKDLFIELVEFPITGLYNCVKLGLIKGGSLIDLSLGCTPFQLLPMYKLFSDITLLEINDGCIGDIERWVRGERDSFDWAHTAEVLAKLQGCSINWKEMENDLRSRVKRILKCDLNKANPADPVILEKADCLINMYMLGPVSKDLDDYKRKVKNFGSMLKKGGSLLILGGFCVSHCTANEEKFNTLSFQEGDLRKIMKDNGYRIQHFEKIGKKSSVDFINFEHIFFLCAVKETED